MPAQKSSATRPPLSSSCSSALRWTASNSISCVIPCSSSSTKQPKISLPDGGEFLDGTVDYDLDCPPLRQGRNTLEVCLVKRCPKLAIPLTLGGVEIMIRYT